MASEHSSSEPALHEMTLITISSGLLPNPPPSTPFVPPLRTDWDILFQPLFDELLTPSPSVDLPAPEVTAPIAKVVALEPAKLADLPSLTTINQDALSFNIAHMNNDPFFGIPIPNNASESSSLDVIPTIVHTTAPISKHVTKLSKDHPLDNIIGELKRPVSTRVQLHEQALFCYYDAFLTLVELKNYKEALTQACWIETMQEELNEFERLEVWELVPRPDKMMVITLNGSISQPDEFVDQENPNHVYKLKNALYGLKQAPRAWYDLLSKFLLSHDFSKGTVDPTLFIKRQGKDILLAPPSPDYMPGSEELEQAPPLPEFVLEPVYPDFIPLEDEILLAEEIPRRMTRNPEEDPTDYPTDRDDDDEEGESFRDEADDQEEDEDKEEEEHPTLADSIPPPHVHRITSRMSIREKPPTPFWSEIPSPPLPVSSPVHVSSPPLPASPTYPLGYRAIMIRLRAETPSTSHLLPSGTRYNVSESSSTAAARATRGMRADYGFVATLDDEIRRDPESMTDFAITGVANALAVRDADRNTNDEDNHVSRTCVRRTKRVTCECTYLDFMKCQPLNFKGTEGVVQLTQGFEKMETVFRISNCSVENQIKFSTCTLLGSALTWRNSHVMSVGHDVMYAMTLADLKKKMTDKYCPRMFPEESDKIERYVGGLPDMIHRSVVTSMPKTMQEAIEMATELIDKKIRTLLSIQHRPKESKMITNNNNSRTRGRTLAGLILLDWVRSHTRDLNPYALSVTITTTVQVLPNAISATRLAIWLVTIGVWKMPTLPTTKLALGQVRSILVMNVEPKSISRRRHAGTNPDSNVVMGMFLLNNRYAFILFDTGADRSFVSTAFSSQIVITPTTLDHYYDVELADGRIIRIAPCTHRGLCRGNCGSNNSAKHFEIKHSLINMMTSDQFFGLEKDNPHDHIRAARRWLKKEPPHSILTWEDLVSKFNNEFFPPSRMNNLRNEISNFQQRFDESFHEAWDHYKDLLRACPHHGFTELHQLDTFYNALNPVDQDSLNSAAGGILLERRTQDVLTIIKNKSKFLAADGKTFLEFRDNIQGYVSAASVNYNQGRLSCSEYG
uniref:Reverse transcriptase domain-containing protein n=1 Tax=Tanacetum cinerariifolium TaxID=118510 RepID=A0A6L2MU46_TANCI|nr:reverse transcriptase domain-containing protein [Tanacetum cinerariifolium]